MHYYFDWSAAVLSPTAEPIDQLHTYQNLALLYNLQLIGKHQNLDYNPPTII